MAKEKKEIVVKSKVVLHGKRARLIRGENEVTGVLIAKDHQKNSNNFLFEFKDEKGNKCVSTVSKDELNDIEMYLLDY
jgi:hypothetical protein